MYLRFRLFSHRIVFYSRRIYEVFGINSNLKDNNHMILLDCDNVNIRELETECIRLQEKFSLSDFIIFNSGRPDSYHCWCFTKKTWRECIRIVSDCEYVDLKYLQFSLRRTHFTLRISKKAGRQTEMVSIIKSKILHDCGLDDLASYVHYETANK